MDKTSNKYSAVLVYAGLAVATLIAFEPVRHNGFINLDDNTYVTDNPHVNGPLTRESVVWAFTTPHGGTSYWHPLTWLSHMVDCELFGLNPLWHHMMNLLLHTANTLLLFWVFKRMTAKVWQSAFVAAVFALHPLHVESVAWVAERKDVLSMFFWLLTIAAYTEYTRRGGIPRYLLVIAAFTLALMSKPMVVTLPFVLLLLDWWPLGRFEKLSVRQLVSEKTPLFILAAILCVVTYIIQQRLGVMGQGAGLSLIARISNTLTSYISYISMMFYPVRLAVLYPHPAAKLPLYQAIVYFVILAAVTALVIYMGRRRRYLTTGWLWYLGTLVPVIGFVQVGAQSMADRYTYIPLIGLFMIIAWGAAEVFGNRRYRNLMLGASAGVVLVILLICTRMQVGRWKNSFTLYEHTLAVTKNNHLIHNNYGAAFFEEWQLDRAMEHFKESLRIKPYYSKARENIGRTFFRQGRFDEAIEYFTRELANKPDLPRAHNNLGIALAQRGKFDEAISHFESELRIDPDCADAHIRLGILLSRRGQLRRAAGHHTEALRLEGDNVDVLNALAWMLATAEDANVRDPADAVKYAQRACELTNNQKPELLDTLAAAYAAAAQFDEAIIAAQKALRLAQSAGQKELAENIKNRLSLYQQEKPYIRTLPDNE